jgi:prepilin peptidase CpaA
MNLELSNIWLILSNIVLLGLITISAFTDIKYRKIYNKITLPSLLTGLILGLLISHRTVFPSRLIGLAVGFGVFFIMFISGYMGGGDVKLVAAIGALIGFPLIIDAIFFGVFSGGLYAIIILLKKGLLWKHLKSVFLFIFSFIIPWRQTHSLKTESSMKIPYGLCISVGTLIAFIIHLTMSINSFFFNY